MYHDQIRDILTKHGRLATDVKKLGDDSDLYHAGLTSLITVNLLLAIEDHFGIEFPDALLSGRTFKLRVPLRAAGREEHTASTVGYEKISEQPL